MMSHLCDFGVPINWSLFTHNGVSKRKTQNYINLKTQLIKEALKGLSLIKIVHHLPQFWRQSHGRTHRSHQES